MYRLYIGKWQKTTEKHTYCNDATKYMLVYTDKKPKGDFRAVPPQKESALSGDEKRWLNACKVAINAEYMREHENIYADILSAFCDALETELKKEKRRTTKNAEKNG